MATQAPQAPGVADRYGLARVDRERHWTAIIDGALVLAVVCWLAVLRLGAAPAGVRWGVTLVLVAMVAHRGLLLVERLRHRRGDRTVAAR